MIKKRDYVATYPKRLHFKNKLNEQKKLIGQELNNFELSFSLF